MTYKVICGNCVGNGYLTIKLYDQHEVDDIIYNTCSRKRLQ